MSFRPLNRPLSLLESRVLAVLIEKERTVPDSYPLTLNYLVSGCNQKTSRNPLMELSEADVQLAIDSLKQLSLVFEGSGGRVARYEHNIRRVMQVSEQATALLAALMLRGPQTLSELRINSERLYKFADISSVEGFMNELAEGETPLVKELPRAAGMRENRWAHLLCGEEGIAQFESTASASTPYTMGTGSDIALSELSNLKNRVAELERQNTYLAGAVDTLLKELGITLGEPEAKPAPHGGQ